MMPTKRNTHTRSVSPCKRQTPVSEVLYYDYEAQSLSARWLPAWGILAVASHTHPWSILGPPTSTQMVPSFSSMLSVTYRCKADVSFEITAY
jgi:hypothetical protein